jgi:hypothetical protein
MFTVTVTFEQNRLENEHLSSAYELILPTISDKIDRKRIVAKASSEKPQPNQIQIDIFRPASIVNS